jgi:putative glutamine amidotransferase
LLLKNFYLVFCRNVLSVEAKMIGMQKPVIGIVLDYEVKKTSQGGYSDRPWYALRTDYAKAISNNGGVPIHIPYAEDLIDDYIKLCDGILIPGGEYDIHPSFYGRKLIKEVNFSTNDRTIFEIKLLEQVMDNDVPFLGICAGQQLLNVGLGGSLYEDIDAQIQTNIAHKNHGKSQDTLCHDIEIVAETKLAQIFKKTTLLVNSHHHQSLRDLGDGLIVNAKAADGVIEGVEHKTHSFCLGVVWHPEYETNVEESHLFQAFIAAAQKHKQNKK